MDNSKPVEISKRVWENTYIQNISKMIGVGYRYTGDRQIAEDLAQDAFIIAYEKIESYKGKGPFEAWLRRIMVNVCLQYLREQNKKKYLNDWLKNEIATVEAYEENIKHELSDLTETELLEAINQLPEHHKLVFNLYVLDKFTHAQIGKELGISEGTSKSHLARARKKIKDLLNEKPGTGKKKTAFLLLFWNVDNVYKKRFKDFAIPSQKDFYFDSVHGPSAPVPNFVPAISILKKLSFFGVTSVITTIAIVSLLFLTKNKQPAKIPPGDSATISQNSILLNDSNLLNKKSANMKNLKAIGSALLISGTNLLMPVNGQAPAKVENKSATQIEVKPGVSLTNQTHHKTIVNTATEVGLTSITDSNASIQAKGNSDVKAAGDLTGTFYAEKLYWSATDNELYFEGKSIIHFGENNNIVNGTTNFLGKVYYLVIDGKPVKLETKMKQDIKLTDKKYNLTKLSPKSAIEKYGDVGRMGAVEISLYE